MKILVVGDAHFRLDLPYAQLFKDRRRGEWEQVKKTIQDAAKGCDVVVMVGDVLNLRHNHSSVIQEFVHFLDGFGDKQVYILSGNHEVFESTKTAIDFLHHAKKDNWHIITPPAMLQVPDIGGGHSAAFLPYMTNGALGVEDSKSATKEIMTMLKPADFLFHHHAMSGTKSLDSTTDLFDEAVLPKDQLAKKFGMVFGGHIHEPSRDGNVTVTGSLFTNSIGEDKRSVWRVDAETREVEEIPLPVRPIYGIEVMNISTNELIADLAKLNHRSIIKLINHDKKIDIEKLKAELDTFDAHILIEDYPNERTKAHVKDGASNDLSVPGLLKTYAKARGVDEKDLLTAFEMIRS